MEQLISPAQRDTLLDTLKARFQQTPSYHPNLSWDRVRKQLLNAPEKLAALYAMEETGGEPNVVSDPEHPSAIVFMDCAAETPEQRRSLCYDEAARKARKRNPPMGSAVHHAAAIGIALLSETQYKALQTLGEFDLKTSSWIKTPADIRQKGGALFCDKRYGQVFVYHNSADSYYSSRGYRGFLVL